MSAYSIALFFHIVGASGFFIGLGLEWMAIHRLRHAEAVEQVREWLFVTKMARRAGMASMVILLAAAAYLMTAWNGAVWMTVAFGAMVVMSLLSGLVSGRRLNAIAKAAVTQGGPIDMALYPLLHDALLWVSSLTRLGISVGIVFVMTVKPDLAGSLIATSAGALLGAIAGLLTLGREHQQKAAAPRSA